MSGHSKWATTKHKKAAIDAKRSNLWAKLIKNIEVAARTGGGDPAGNPTLFDAVLKAKKNSVPKDNIDRAVKRGSGAEGGGANYESILYGGTGPGGTSLYIECLTDNKNRAAGDVRLALTRHGGSLADVSYLFSRKGVILVPSGNGVTEDSILEAVLEQEPEEVNDLGDAFEIVTDPSSLIPTRQALQAANIDYDSAEANFVASTLIPVDVETCKKVLRLIEALEDSDDVQNVYSNFDASDEVLEAASED